MPTIPTKRIGTDAHFKVTLKDSGVAVAWDTTDIKAVCMYSEEQRAYAGKCSAVVDPEDNTLLNVLYPASEQLYTGRHRIVVRIVIDGNEATYDAFAIAFRAMDDDSTVDASDTVDPIDIEVSELDTTVMHEILANCMAATDNAEKVVESIKGGLEGQALVKQSDADLDFKWKNVEGLTVVDSLNSDSPSAALSARQGKVLKGLVDGKQPTISDLQTIRSNATAGKAASDALDGHTVAKSVPADAKFTDTVYDDTALKQRVSTIEGKESGWDSKVGEAPTDGKQYARKNGAWVEVQGGQGGTSDFENLENRPKYNGSVMDRNTNIPQVKTLDWDGKYSKPSDGIPKTDLASGVQSSLEKADSALQASALNPYRTASDQNIIDAQKTETLVVNFTLDEQTGTVSCDKTYAEIVAAYNAGYYVYALFSPSVGEVVTVPLVIVTEGDLAFEGFSGWNGNFNSFGATLDDDDVVTRFWNYTDNAVIEVASLPTENILEATYLVSTGANRGHFFKYDFTNDAWVDITAIPSVPVISTDIAADKTSDAKTASPKAVYDAINPSVGSSIPSGGLLPNKLYNLGTLTGSVTINFASAISGIANHWFFTFETGATAPSITWDSSITSWMGGSAPTINASKHYEISVLGGVGVFMEV